MIELTHLLAATGPFTVNPFNLKLKLFISHNILKSGYRVNIRVATKILLRFLWISYIGGGLLDTGSKQANLHGIV